MYTVLYEILFSGRDCLTYASGNIFVGRLSRTLVSIDISEASIEMLLLTKEVVPKNILFTLAMLADFLERVLEEGWKIIPFQEVFEALRLFLQLNVGIVLSI